MSSVLFTSAQRIIAQVLNWLQASNLGKTSQLITDAFQTGIDNSTPIGEGFIVVPGTNNTSFLPTVNVTTGGIAYDNVGNRIYINPSDSTLYNTANITSTTNDGLGNLVPTPQSTGVINIPLTQSSFNYLWIDYLTTTDVSVYTLNKITNAKQFYKQTDGYNIIVTTVNIPPNATSVYLATIDMTAFPIAAVAPSNISPIGRTYFSVLSNIVPIITAQANRSDATVTYNPSSTYTLDTHIKAVGTGQVKATNPHGTSLVDMGVTTLDTVVGHRQLEHGNAIIAGIAGTAANAYPITSAMYAAINIVNPGNDYLTILQLLSNEYAIVNGTAYNVTDIFGAIPVNANIFFTSLPTGTYNVYWDSVVKLFSVTTSSIASDVTKLWLCTVDWTLNFAPGYNHISNFIDRRRIGSTTDKYQRWVTSARPPNPLYGEYGYNMTINAPEYFDGTTWQSLLMPTGSILDFAGSVAPVGFLFNDGSIISQITYANLFSVIGTTFNTGGEGTGNFRLPNKQRRVSVGAGGVGTGTLGNTVGNTGGAETVIPTQNAHNHTQDAHNHTQDAHNHTQDAHNHVTDVLTIPGQIAYANPALYGTTNISIANDVFTGAGSGSGAGVFPGHNTSSTTATNQSTTATNQSTTATNQSTTATDNASSVIQPSLVLNSIIKY
jgi:microcystin-dependent protein